jgi:hypothetical protein
VWRRAIVGAVVALAAVGIALLVLPAGRRGSFVEGGSPSTAPTLPRGFVSETTVVQSVSNLYSSPTTSSPSAGAAGSNVASKTGPAKEQTTPENTAPPVAFSFTGSCSAKASNYTCKIAVVASDGLMSAGYVTVFPGTGTTQRCLSSKPLVRNSVSISGTCPVPYAPKVLAVYSLTTDVTGTKIASAYVPWA